MESEPSAQQVLSQKQLKGKRKKEFKKLLQGKLTHASTVLRADDMHGATASFDLTRQKSGRGIESVSGADVQQLVLWMFHEAVSPQWVNVCNRGLVGATALLFLRGGSFGDVAAAQQRATTPSFFSSCPSIKTGMPRYRPAQRHAPRSIDHEMMQVSETSMRQRVGGGKVDMQQLGASSGSGGSRDTEAEEPAVPGYVESLIYACCTASELAAHGFPVASPKPTSLPAGSAPLIASLLAGWMGEESIETPQAAAQAIETCKVLQFPPAFEATRTACMDFHAAMAMPSPECGCGSCCYSPSGSTPPVAPRLLALDCEMCSTAAGPQVARVTLVDDAGAVLLDEFVKPELPVLDYLTQYSGVTPGALATAKLSLPEVRRRLIDLIDGPTAAAAAYSASPLAPSAAPPAASSTDSSAASTSSSTGVSGECRCCGKSAVTLSPSVLIGHSLESDLVSLRLVHSRVMDTSLLFAHPNGLPSRHALRVLVKQHLDRVIQAGHGTTGHDSVEDTVAVMDLIHSLLPPRETAAAAAVCMLPRHLGDSSSAGAASVSSAAAVSEREGDDAIAADAEERSCEENPRPAKRLRQTSPSPPSCDISAPNFTTVASEVATAAAVIDDFGDGNDSPALHVWSHWFGRRHLASPGRIHMLPRAGTSWRGLYSPSASGLHSEGDGLNATALPSSSASSASSSSSSRFSSRGLAGLASTLMPVEHGAAAYVAAAASGNEPRTTNSSLSSSYASSSSNASSSAPVRSSTATTESWLLRRSLSPLVAADGKPSRSGHSLLSLPFFSTRSVCGGVSLVGSPSFVRAHLCGSANGVSLPTSSAIADTSRVLQKIADEARRFASARANDSSGGGKGPALLIGELHLPSKTHAAGGGAGRGGSSDATTSVDWEALDAALYRWSRSLLPPSTAVILVTQPDAPVLGDGSLAPPPPQGQWGATLFHVTPRPKVAVADNAITEARLVLRPETESRVADGGGAAE